MFQDEARFGRISDTRYCWAHRLQLEFQGVFAPHLSVFPLAHLSLSYC